DDVLGPQTAIGAIAITTVAPLAGGGIIEHDDFMLEVFGLNAREGISELAPRRQLDEQEHAGAFQQQPSESDHVLALAHRLPRGTIDPVPELLNLGMEGTPL